MSLRDAVQGSIQSGWLLGDDPSKEELREEVQRLREQGMAANEIGKRIGTVYMAKDNKAALDRLEEVLTEEFEEYGGEER